MFNILCTILCILQYIVFIDGQNATVMPVQSICTPGQVRFSCPPNYSYVVRTAFHGITNTPGKCEYTPGDCIADAMSSMGCTSDAAVCLIFLSTKKLSQCNDQPSSYFHVEYDCVPSKMDDPAKVYDVCLTSTDITSEHGIIQSPGYPSPVQTTTNECLRAIHIPASKTLRLWLSDLYIGSTSTNCADDHVYVVDNIQTFKLCGQRRFAYPYLCSSTILLQYLIKTDLPIYRGMRMYFEITDRLFNDTCPTGTVTPIPGSTTTPVTVDPPTTTETPAYVQLGIASPVQTFQLCTSQTHTIMCPNNYTIAVLTNILGVTSSGQCEPHDAAKDCVVTLDQALPCRQSCSFQYLGNQVLTSCNSKIATYHYVEYQCIPTHTNHILANTSCAQSGSKTLVSFDRNGRFQSYDYPKLIKSNCTYRLQTKPGDIIRVYSLDISLNNYDTLCDKNKITFIEDTEQQGTSFCEERKADLIYSSCSNELDLHYQIEDDSLAASAGFDLYLESQTRPIDWKCGSSSSTPVSSTTIHTTPSTPQPTSITSGSFVSALDEVEYDICFGESLNLACPYGYTFMVIGAYYGVKGQPGNKCGYVDNDCVQEATSTITQCHTDAANCIIPYNNKRRLAQCSDNYADYLHIIYQCVPSFPISEGSQLSVYNVCTTNQIRDVNGIVSSPNFPTYIPTSDECKVDMFGVHDRLLKIWVNEVALSTGTQHTENSDQADLVIYKRDEFEDILKMYPEIRDVCTTDYLILNTRFVVYIYCGTRKVALQPVCTSSATIQYRATTPANPVSKGFKFYFEWIEKPPEVTCAGTPGTVDPTAPTTVTPIEVLPIWALNLDISPLFSKHICLGTSDSIRCPRRNDYVIAVEDSKYGVTSTGLCDIPSFSDCYEKTALNLACTNACPIEYIVPKVLSHCENKTANYLTLDYECVPTRLANDENPIDICSSTPTETIAVNKGMMISPKYPSLDAASHTCSKTIETIPSKIWMIYIVDLFLESENTFGDCDHAALTINDGNDVRIICGLQEPQLVLTSCSNIVRFDFRSSQQALGYRGFKLFFRTIDVPPGWACTPSGFTTTIQPSTTQTSPPVTLIPPTLQIPTYGGTTSGNVRQYCQFPFTYQGTLHTKCIDSQPPDAAVVKTDSWCSLTSNYDTNHQWGFCDIGMTDSTSYDICRSRSQRLQCVADYVIHIVTADYAAKDDGSISCNYSPTDCFQSDISAIQTTCAGKMSCTVYNFGKTLASCQNRLSSYLRIEYTCAPATVPEIQTYDMCSSSPLPNNTRRGFLISPNYPNSLNNIDCTFTIQPKQPLQDIYLYIIDMGLNAPNNFGESCSKDRLIATAGSNRKETCGLAFTSLFMKTCQIPVFVRLARTTDAQGRGVKLYFEFRDRSPDEICDQITTPATTPIPISTTATPRPLYFPNPSQRMIKTLCYPDVSGAFGASNFQCPSGYVLVIHRALYGTGDRCTYTPGDCTHEADRVYADCSGRQECSISFETIVTLTQCNQVPADYLSVEYQCLPTLNITDNIQDLCINRAEDLDGISGILRSPSYPQYIPTGCSNLQFKAPQDSDLIIYMYLLELNIGVPNVETGICTEDYLRLSYQCNNQTFDQYLCGTRGTELLFDTCSPNDKITISFNLTSSTPQSYRGFALVYHVIPGAGLTTVAPPTGPTKKPHEPDESDYGAIVGGIMGGLLLIVLCLAGYLYYRRTYSNSRGHVERAVVFKTDRESVQESTNNAQTVSLPQDEAKETLTSFVTPFAAVKATVDDTEA